MKTTRFLKSSLLLAACQVTSLAAQTQQPNIIMFLVDDMGWQDTSVPFFSDTTNLNRRFKTPNMERLAQMGVCFTEAYACPVSSPSRCSLMSGMNAARHRVTNWTRFYNQKTDAGSNVINIPDWNYNGIQPADANEHDRKNGTPITSLPEILKKNGYYTVHCGKAHFGSENTAGANPINFGFDVNIAGGANGAPGSYLGLENFGNPGSQQAVKGLEKYHGKDVFLTDVLTDEAIEAIKTPIKNKQPFYLYMSHYAVHSPYSEDKKRTPHYRGHFDKQLNATLNESEVRYAAIVEGMDASLGSILDFLEKQDESVQKNTIILFMSDNGGQALNNVRQGRANFDQNYPARAGKGSAFMGGVKEPMIVSWPGVTTPNTRTDQRVMIEDFFPTILEMAQVKEYKTVQQTDGKSFASVLRDAQKGKYDRTIYWHFPNLWGETQDKEEGYGATSAILKGEYHLIYTWETQRLRLYNIKEDLAERNDLSAKMPEKVKELAKDLTDYLKSCDAQRPSYKDTGKEIPWPDQVVPTGDVLRVDESIFQLSTDTEKHYYLIADRSSQSAQVGGTYYWTRGKHYDQNAIQVSSGIRRGTEIQDQLFYFLKGSDDQHFRIMTYDGQEVSFTEGKTSVDWNDGRPDANGTTTVKPYLQYGVAAATNKEFQLRQSAHRDYYGVSCGDQVLNNWGAEQGTSGVADMKWAIGAVAGKPGEILSGNNGSQFNFMPYDENSFTTYYKEGKITEADQLQDGDFVVLQNITDTKERQGYVQFGPDKLVTLKGGMNDPVLGFTKTCFDGTGVFRIKVAGDKYYFMNAAGTLYMPADTENGAAMVPTKDVAKAAYTLEKNSQKDFAWNIKSTCKEGYLNGNAGSPTIWSSAHPYLIYKVGLSEKSLDQNPWFYLSVLKGDNGRGGRAMQVGNDQGNASRIWTAPAMQQTENQLWRFETCYGKTALVNKTEPAYSIQSNPETGAGSADAKFVYSHTTKDYGFKVNTADVKVGGIPMLTLQRANTKTWYLNASQSGKKFDVNEFDNPASGNAGYWAPVAAVALTQTADNMALGCFVAPFAVSLPQHVKAYVATGIQKSYLIMEALSGQVVPANTPVILKAEKAGYYPLKQADNQSAGNRPEKNLLQGSGDAPLLFAANACLTLNFDHDKAAFAPDEDGIVPALQVYCQGQTDTLYLDFDGTATGIHQVATDIDKEEEIYDLQGRKVSHIVKKGVYIKDGKKVVIP